MSWFKDKVPVLKKAIEEVKTQRSHLSVRSVCIHGETDCVRCAASDYDQQQSIDYKWEALDEDDVKRIVFKLPKKVRDMMKRHPSKVVVAGGFIRALVGREEIKDLDIFVNLQANAKDWCNEVGLDYEAGDKCLLSSPTKDFDYEIQTIWRYSFKEPYEIPEQFDYTVCKACIWYDEGDKDKKPDFIGICHDRFYRDIAKKALVYYCDRDTERVMSIPRLLRYTQYGYSIDPKSMAEVILKTCLSLDLTNGFDGAFKQLEEAYKAAGNEKEWTEIVKPYVKPKLKSKPREPEYTWSS